MVAVMRCILAVSAALTIYLHPVQPDRLLGLTYSSLIFYCLYAVLLAGSVYRGRPMLAWRAQHWVDVLFYAFLLHLTFGTESIFFFFFFFAILVASFSRGFAEGIAVTTASVLLYVGVGLPTSAGRIGFELDRALVQAVFLFVLGYLIAFWGGNELSLRRRLQLLKELGTATNLRLGADHAMVQNLRRLLDFYGADVAVLVSPRPGTGEYVMYRVDRRGQSTSSQPGVLPEQAARALLDFPPSLSVAWNPRRPRDCPVEQCRRLANLLETSYFVTAPFRQHEGLPGRLYITSGERPFREADAEFLSQAVRQIAATVHNLVLLEQLMENATQVQRSRISRDLHDTAVQPYIGLRIALEALLRKCDPDTSMGRQVKELLDMAALTIEDLRGYVTRLRQHEPAWAGVHLIAALREQIARYRNFYGLEVDLRGDEMVQLSDRVAGEAFNLVCEALSNVYRHAGGKRAFVELRCKAGTLAICVGNERVPGGPAVRFTPRSIAERAAALGGTTEVRADGATDVVEVTIPL
jgi:signal transduction histidine kinase